MNHKSFMGRITTAGKIQEVFELPDGKLQFLINGAYYHENSVMHPNILRIKEYIREINPTPYQIWAIKRFVYEARHNTCSEFIQKQFAIYNDRYNCIKRRGLSKRNYGQIDNYMLLLQNAEFKLQTLTTNKQ